MMNLVGNWVVVFHKDTDEVNLHPASEFTANVVALGAERLRCTLLATFSLREHADLFMEALSESLEEFEE